MIIGIDTGAGDYQEAEHVAHTMPDVLRPLVGGDRGDVIASTHVAAGEIRRDAVAMTIPGDVTAEGAADVGCRVLAALPAGSAVVVTSGGAADAYSAGPAPARAGAWAAVAQAATRSAGRLVHYPGRQLMVGTFPVGELRERAAIDEVVVIGDTTAPSPELLLDTRDYVRPIWREGRVVLLVQPAAGGTLAPFEIEDPPRCCDGH